MTKLKKYCLVKRSVGKKKRKKKKKIKKTLVWSTAQSKYLFAHTNILQPLYKVVISQSFLPERTKKKADIVKIYMLLLVLPTP